MKIAPTTRRLIFGLVVAMLAGNARAEDVSGDDDAISAVFAGAWTGAKKISIFEGVSQYKKDTQKPFSPRIEMDCRLELDMDGRKVKLTINGAVLESAFTESLTSVGYIGFGVRGATSLFSKPVIQGD